MAIQDAIRFVNDLQNDDALRQTVSLDRDQVVIAARAKGYNVTPDEMKQALNQHWTATPNSKVFSEVPGF